MVHSVDPASDDRQLLADDSPYMLYNGRGSPRQTVTDTKRTSPRMTA